MATDRADAVCAPNGQAPINSSSAASWILPGINPTALVCGRKHLDARVNAGSAEQPSAPFSLIFLTKIGFISQISGAHLIPPA
jgi:hypothetical protein